MSEKKNIHALEDDALETITGGAFINPLDTIEIISAPWNHSCENFLCQYCGSTRGTHSAGCPSNQHGGSKCYSCTYLTTYYDKGYCCSYRKKSSRGRR